MPATRASSRRAVLGAAGAAALAMAAPRLCARGKPAEADTYDEKTILADIAEFFGSTTEGLAKIVARLFAELGRPNGYIRGEELSGAIGIGLRYGNGRLVLKNRGQRRVYWQGPSIGFDLGGNASKVYVLTYALPSIDAIFQRFPGVDGSFYYVGGIGVNYQRRGNVTLAPIRLGVGWRAGASIGYMHYTREKTLIPL
jgi:hypothetical protein